MVSIEKTPLSGVWLLKPKIFEDSRGHFLEVYRYQFLKQEGIDIEFVQDNVSKSAKGTLRGLHYQKAPASQAKLVMAVHGKVLDVAVDMRKYSATFGQHFSAELSSENRHMILIPSGFAHGFSVLSDEATIYYKCSDYYNKELERGVRWDDPELNINWKVEKPILSDKDQSLPYFKDIDNNDFF